MSIQSLRSTQADDNHWQDVLRTFSHQRISLSDIREKHVDGMFDGYEFHHQTVYQGQISYVPEYEEDTDPRYRHSVDGTFEFRTGSEMFILRMDSDVPTPDTIISDLNNVFAQELKIYRNLFATTEYLWEFLEEAEYYLDITVLIRGREHSISEAFSSDLDEIELGPEYLEKVHGGEIAGIPLDEIVGHSPIQRAEVMFEHLGGTFVVRYSEGSLSIRNPTEDQSEYIIQIFEHYVLGR